jgi:hypothetical protein
LGGGGIVGCRLYLNDNNAETALKN